MIAILQNPPKQPKGYFLYPTVSAVLAPSAYGATPYYMRAVREQRLVAHKMRGWNNER